MTGSLSPAGPRLVAGDRLGRNELLCPLAEGGMAAVWLANQRDHRGITRQVALKTILPVYASDAEFRRLFEDESRIAARIQHENVAQVLEVGDNRDRLYLVIEWVDGDSLRTLERVAARSSVRVPQEILLRILSDACAGLHAAHEVVDERGKGLGVVHRDISPQNILVSSRGITKVIDFGVAKARDRLSLDTKPGIVKGKPLYMAPEQALGLAVDRRADIWALAAVFYRLVTGKPPFEASNVISTMQVVRRGRIAEPLCERRDVHPAVGEVMEVALSPSASGRFETAAAMRDALEAAMTRAGLRADTAAVAAFCGEHLGARRSARHRMIRAALEAARARTPPAVRSFTPPCSSAVRPGAYRIIDNTST